MNAGMHQFPAGFREQAAPHADPWGIVTLVMHDLSVHGIKSRYGAETDLGEAARHAAALLESLGVTPAVPDDTP